MSVGRKALALTGCLMVSGCVLTSEAPIFDDSHSELALGDSPARYRMSYFEDGIWQPDEDASFEMIPEGQHYLPRFSDDTSEDQMTIHFVSLGPEHWVLQVVEARDEGDDLIYYNLATLDKAEILVTPIACEALEGRPGIADLVTFDGDICQLNPPAPGTRPDFPYILWQDLPPAEMKLVPLH